MGEQEDAIAESLTRPKSRMRTDGTPSIEQAFIIMLGNHIAESNVTTRFRPETIAWKFIDKVERAGLTLKEFSESPGRIKLESFYSVPIRVLHFAAIDAAQLLADAESLLVEIARRDQNDLLLAKAKEAAEKRDIFVICPILTEAKGTLFAKVISILEESGWLEPNRAFAPGGLLPHLKNRMLDEVVSAGNSGRMAELIANAESNWGIISMVERCVMKSWMEPLSLVVTNNNGEGFKSHVGSGTISTLGNPADIAADGINHIMRASAAEVNKAKAAALAFVASYPRPGAAERKEERAEQKPVQSARTEQAEALPSDQALVAFSASAEKCAHYLSNRYDISEKPTAEDWRRAIRHWVAQKRTDLLQKTEESGIVPVPAKVRREAWKQLRDLRVREMMDIIKDNKKFAAYRENIVSARPRELGAQRRIRG